MNQTEQTTNQTAQKETQAQTHTPSPAPIKDLRVQMCPRYEHAMQIIGKRWTGLLLDVLMNGPCRFSELTTFVEGLSDRVLSDRLRELEAEGIVKRVVYPQIPVRVEYQLTDKGYALQPSIAALHQWAENWINPDCSEQCKDDQSE
jgi:DNA-binding HxlR family transcriptional regulator